MSLAGVLLVVFIILKLVGVIAWSWLWVLSPLWIGIAIWAVCMIFVLIIGAIGASKY